jgi:hypothetical protein
MPSAPDAAAGSDLSFVAVRTTRGPHVTPQLAAEAGGRLWFATTNDSLKARVLRRRPAVSVWQPGSVVVGTAAVLDVLRPGSLLRAPFDTMRSGLGMAAYAFENMDDMVNGVFDALTLRLGDNALERRVLVAVTVESSFDVPLGGDAAVGLLVGDAGVVALPGWWDPASSTAFVEPLAGGLLDGPAAVAVDASQGAGPAQKQGVLHRGTGRRVAGGLALDIERSTWWNGASVGTVHWWPTTE